MSNHGELTGLMLASTYNDAAHPEYGLVFVQGPSTSSYNVWSISPDGPAKGNGLNFHYGSGVTNIHSPGYAKVTFKGDGKVGIGTTAPNAPLTVWTASTATSQSALRLNNPGGFNSAGAGCEIIFSQDRTTSEDLRMAAISSMQVSTGSSAHGALRFWTRASSSITEKVRIQHNGIISASAGITLGDGLGYTTANTLDDYEEGTFTGVFSHGGSSTDLATSYNYSICKYTKIGNLVTYIIDIDGNGINTNAPNGGFLSISGLPFLSSNVHSYPVAGSRNTTALTCASTQEPRFWVNSSTQYVYIQFDTPHTGASASGGTWNSSGRINITGHYYTA
jgi:hypothetical protein